MNTTAAAMPHPHPTATVVNSGERTPLLILSKSSNAVAYLGITTEAAAFRMVVRPALPVLPPVRSVHRMNGTGISTRNAAFRTTPTLLLHNALLGGYGTVGATGASRSQPLRRLTTLNLLATIIMVGRSELRSLVPRFRSLALGLRWTRSLHN